MGIGCLGFFMKMGRAAVPTLDTRDVPRRPDRDAGMLVGWSCSNIWDGILF